MTNDEIKGWWQDTGECPKCHKFCSLEPRKWNQHTKKCCPELLSNMPKPTIPEMISVNNGNGKKVEIWEVFADFHNSLMEEFPGCFVIFGENTGEYLTYSFKVGGIAQEGRGAQDPQGADRGPADTYYLQFACDGKIDNEIDTTNYLVMQEPSEIWIDRDTSMLKLLGINVKDDRKNQDDLIRERTKVRIGGKYDVIFEILEKWIVMQAENVAQRAKDRAARKARLLRNGDHMVYVLHSIEEKIGGGHLTNLKYSYEKDGINFSVTAYRRGENDSRGGKQKYDSFKIKIYPDFWGDLTDDPDDEPIQSDIHRLTSPVMYEWSVKRKPADPEFNPEEYADRIVKTINSMCASINLLDTELKE